MKSEHINSQRAEQYLMGELSREEVLRIQRHLIYCVLCSDAIEGMAQELNLEENPTFGWEEEGEAIALMAEPDLLKIEESVAEYVPAHTRQSRIGQEVSRLFEVAMHPETAPLRRRFSLQPAAWAVAATVALFVVFNLLNPSLEKPDVFAENPLPGTPVLDDPQADEGNADEVQVAESSPTLAESQHVDPDAGALADAVNQIQPGTIVSESDGEVILTLAEDGSIPHNALGLPEGAKLTASDTFLLASNIINLLPGNLESDKALNESVSRPAAEAAPAAGYNGESRAALDSEMAKKTEQDKEVNQTEISYSVAVWVDEAGAISALYPSNLPNACRDHFDQWLENNFYRFARASSLSNLRSVIYPIRLTCP